MKPNMRNALTRISTDKIQKDLETKGGCVMSRCFHHATLLIFAVGLLVPASLAAQDVVYTGCIKSTDGSLYSVRADTTPLAPCKAKDKQISWNMAGQLGPQGPPGPPLDITVNVDCDQGESINVALAQPANKLTVLISGSCEEEVVINRDDVTLQGVGTDPTITAPAGAGNAIRIQGAHHVNLRGLHLAGGFHTVAADSFASFEASALQVIGALHCGIVIGNSSAYVSSSEISENEAGACAGWGASLIIQESKIINNTFMGVNTNFAQVTLTGTEVAGSQTGLYSQDSIVDAGGPGCSFHDNPAQGLTLQGGSLSMSNCVVGGSDVGVELRVGSTAQIAGNTTIEDTGWAGVAANGGSNIFLFQSVINGGTGVGIWLGDTSTLQGWWDGVWLGTSTVTGTPWGVYCAGSPSVARLAWPFPGVVTNCLAGE